MADKVLVLRDPGDLIEDTGLLDGKADRENGFVDRAESSISFVDGTRTLTVAPTGSSFAYFYASVRHTKSAPDNIVIPDTEGPHYIYYEGDALKSTTVFTNELIISFAFVAAVYWDATGKESVFFNDERHGNVFDSTNHLYEHDTFGARYGGGLGLGNMDVDGNGDDATAAQFSFDDGAVWDEDLEHVITGGVPQTLAPIAEIPMFYRTGAGGFWRRVAATQYPITTAGTGRSAWNEFTGGAWQLTEAGNNDFVLTHYFGTGDTRHPVIGLVGQSEYATVALARAGAVVELQALLFGPLAVLTPEFVATATVIWQTSNAYSNAVKSRVRSTDGGADYIDWRSQRGGIGAGSGGSAASPIFLDSEFRLVDETNLFQLSFQLSGLTANREKTALDAPGTDVLSDAVLTAESIPFVNADGVLDEDTTFVRDAATGNVGIGTSSPSWGLDVSEDADAPAGGQIQNPNSGVSARCQLLLSADRSSMLVGAAGPDYTGLPNWADAGFLNANSSASGGLKLRASQGGIGFSIDGGTSADNHVMLDTGEVGFGTTSPTESFHVQNDTTGPTVLLATTGNFQARFTADSNRSAAGATLFAVTARWNSFNVGQLRFLSGPDTVNKDDGDVQIRTSDGTGLNEVARFTFDGKTGLGTSSPGSKLSVAGAVSNDSEIDNGSSGASATIDWTAGNSQTIALTANATLSFTGVTGAGLFVIRLVQDATGSRTVTWPASAKWPGGTAPTLTSAANAVDVVRFYFDGTDYHGLSSLDSK